jgi:phage shock protein C
MPNNSRKWGLNRQKAWVGGVCAGLADYLNIDILVVRIVCAIAMFTWWPTIVAYIVCYLCLSDKKPSIKEFGRNFTNSRAARHFKNVDYKKRIYKSSRDKKIAGVCAGIANYFEVSPLFVRVLTLGSLFFGPLAFIGYIAAAVVMDRDPDDSEYYQSEKPDRRRKRKHRNNSGRDNERSHTGQTWKSSGTHADSLDKRDMRECGNKFSNLEKKLRRLEATITSKKFKLHSDMKNL